MVTPAGRIGLADTPQERSDEEDWRLTHGKRPPAAEINSHSFHQLLSLTSFQPESKLHITSLY